jgi:hypothetical protein
MNGYDKLRLFLSDKDKTIDSLRNGGCCPPDFGLKECCGISCKECWDKALSREYD